MNLGVVLESMGLGFRQGLSQAAKLGVGGVQADAVGDLAPDRLTDTGKRELRNLLKTFDQSVTALNLPLRRGLDNPENLQPRLEYMRAVMNLAFELGARTVIAPCPKLPGEGEEVRASLLRESLLDLGRHGDRVGTVVALEIGLDAPESVRDYLDKFDVGSLKVNFDPANLLVNGFDPINGILPLHRRIAHVQARDARRSTLSRGTQEVALGAGDIDWLKLVGTLVASEYRGWVVVKRETGEDKVKDAERGIAFLRRMMVPGS